MGTLTRNGGSYLPMSSQPWRPSCRIVADIDYLIGVLLLGPSNGLRVCIAGTVYKALIALTNSHTIYLLPSVYIHIHTRLQPQMCQQISTIYLVTRLPRPSSIIF